MAVLWMLCGTLWRNVDVLWKIVEKCGCFVDVMWNIVEECGCYVEDCGGMWRNVDDLWSNVDVMWNIVEECGCFVDVMWNIVEECGCFVEKCGCNVDPPHLHISQFDQVLSPPWSVILKYAIVDVMWIHQIFTVTIKWTADPFCRLYSSVHLLTVYWSCICSLYCTRALALLYNVSLEALKSYAFAKSLGLVSQDLNS